MTLSHREKEGSTKLAIWDDFQGITGLTRGGRGQKLENWDDVIYGWSLIMIV